MPDHPGICWLCWGTRKKGRKVFFYVVHQRDVGLIWGCNRFGCQALVAYRLSVTHCDMNQQRLQQISAVPLRPVNTARVRWPKAQTRPVCQGCSCDPRISHLQPCPKDSRRRSVCLKCFQQANRLFSPLQDGFEFKKLKMIYNRKSCNLSHNVGENFQQLVRLWWVHT